MLLFPYKLIISTKISKSLIFYALKKVGFKKNKSCLMMYRPSCLVLVLFMDTVLPPQVQ